MEDVGQRNLDPEAKGILQMGARWQGHGPADDTTARWKLTGGELTTNTDDMDEVIRGAWRPVNLRYQHRPEPSVEVFMQHYR